MMKKITTLMMCLFVAIATIAHPALQYREKMSDNRAEKLELVTPVVKQQTKAPVLGGYSDEYEGLVYLESFEDSKKWVAKDAVNLFIPGGSFIEGVRAVDGEYYMTSEPDWAPRDARATSPHIDLETGVSYYVSIYAYTPGVVGQGFTLKDEFRVLARNVETGEETVVIDCSESYARMFTSFTKVEGIFVPEASATYEMELHLCTQDGLVGDVAFDRFAIGTSPDPYQPITLLPQPTGQKIDYLLNYTHSGYGNANIKAQVSFGEENEVYVCGLSPDMYTSWMYGVMHGDTIAFPTGQYVGLFANTYDVFMQGAKDFVVEEIDGQMRWGYVPVDSVYMVLKGDTIVVADGYGFVESVHDVSSGDMIGAMGFIVDYKYHPFSYEIPEPDLENNEPILYQMTADVLGPSVDTNRLTDVVIDGDKLYIKGVSLDTPEGWICGTIKDNTVVFPAHQYVGLYAEYFPVFFEPALVDSETYATEMLDEYVMDYVDGVLTSRTPYMLTQDGVNYSYAVMNLTLKPFELKMAEPLAPVLVEHYQDLSMDNYYAFFVYELKGVDGTFLMPDYLYYRFYFDGELFTFQKPDYPYVSKPTTDVSVLFFDNWSFNKIGETSIMVSIRPLDLVFDELAVEMVYKIDGEEMVSKRTVSKDIMAVESIKNDKTVAQEIYTNLQGMQVDSDTEGFVIKTIVYTDGSRENVKMVNRSKR